MHPGKFLISNYARACTSRWWILITLNGCSAVKKNVEFQVNHCRPITEEEGCDKDYLPYTYGLKVWRTDTDALRCQFAGLTWRLSELQAAHVLRQAVGFGARHGGAGGHGAWWPLPRHLHRGPEQVDLLPMDVLHVVLTNTRQHSNFVLKSHESQTHFYSYEYSDILQLFKPEKAF